MSWGPLPDNWEQQREKLGQIELILEEAAGEYCQQCVSTQDGNHRNQYRYSQNTQLRLEIIDQGFP